MSKVRSRKWKEIAMQRESHKFKVFELRESKVDNCLKLSLATSKTKQQELSETVMLSW